MGAEVYEGYDRISQVSSFIKTEKYVEWCDKTDKRERNKAIKTAQKIGTEVDFLIKKSLEGESLPIIHDNAEVLSCLDAFRRFDERNPNAMFVPGKRYFNESLKITGETDLESPDEIIDIKCSLAIRPEYWLQMGGYLHCRDAKKVSILRLDKNTGGYEYQSVCDVERLKVLFVSVLNLYRYYKENENGDYGC